MIRILQVYNVYVHVAIGFQAFLSHSDYFWNISIRPYKGNPRPKN